MNKNYWTVALLAAIAFSGCQNHRDETVEPPSVRVKVMQVAPDSPTTHRRFSGTVEAESGTALSFPVAGTIQTLPLRLGQHVSKGQLMATLDPASMQSNHRAAQASLRQAEDAYHRMKALHDRGSLPDMQWVEVESKLQQARSLEEIAAKNLKDCKLYAPFDGVVSDKTVEIGQNVLPGMVVGKLVNTRSLKVKIAVPETEIASISLQQEADIYVPALGGKRLTGTTIEKGIQAHPLSRSYEVKLRVDDPGCHLMPGMVTEVLLQPGRPSDTPPCCILPPRAVLLDEQNNYFVWVEKDGKAHKQTIVCGEFFARGVAVVAGLSAGNRVIVEGQHKVCEGTVLTIL